MKKHLVTIALIFQCLIINAQHTFSIAAVDPNTGEIGSAGATCLSEEDGALYVSDIILNVGAINTQAWWTTVNQNAARVRMEAGDSPQEIIDWLIANDNSSQGGSSVDRQYGVVDLKDGMARSAAHTGNSNFDEKGHRVGPGYSIQGNILISQDVLDDMEAAFVNSTGDLSEKLMASMQAAKRPGADVRCLNEGISSASAYIRVAKPTDTNSDYGNLWLDLNVWLDSGTFTGDPIDELQTKFDEFNQSVGTDNNNLSSATIYPNPSDGIVNIKTSEQAHSRIEIFNSLGGLVLNRSITPASHNSEIELEALNSGFYMIKVTYDEANYTTQSVMLFD